MKKSFWQRFLITCNPWFLASTILLLLGIYLIYVDPKLAGDDKLQMNISFTSLQLYEVLCLSVVFLFKRIKLFYDSVFLIAVISILLFVPFITFNQALQFDDRQLELIGYLSLVLAIGKFAAIKLFFKGLNLPSLFLVSGLVMLLMNFAIPFIMKGLNVEDDTSAGAFINDVFSTMIPIIGFLGYLGMYQVTDGKKVYESKWLPLTLFQCFFTVTLINVMSVMYVYDIPQSAFFVAVTLLISAFLSMHPIVGLKKVVRQAVMAAALLISIITLGLDHKLHFIIVLGIILIFSMNNSDKWVTLISFFLLSLVGLSYLPQVSLSYMQLCLFAVLLTLCWLAIEKQEWGYLLLSGVIMVFILKTYYVKELSTIVFWPMSLALFLVCFWDSENYKKEEGMIVSLSSIWAVLALIEHFNVGWETGFKLGLIILVCQMIRKYLFKADQSLFMILNTAVVVLLWLGQKLIELLKEQSFSIIVIVVSFLVFIAGTYVTVTSRPRNT